jgi:hypothetical protein
MPIPEFITAQVDYIKQLDLRWKKCRRCYKWLSILPLSIAHVLSAASVVVFSVGFVIMFSGGCCLATGEAAGYTVTTTVEVASGREVGSRTEDNGIICKCCGLVLMIYALGAMAAGLALHLAAWLFVGASFVYFYEQVNETAVDQWIVPRLNSTPPLKIEYYAKMNRNQTALGVIDQKHGAGFPAKLAYTGGFLCYFPLIFLIH